VATKAPVAAEILYIRLMNETTMHCPDQEAFELAHKLHDRLRYLKGGSDDDQDLVSLLDCFVQDERIRRAERGLF